MNALVVSNLCKRYADKMALTELSFSIPAGAIAGLIGPNGAGKSTCMGIVSGLLSKDSGTVDIFGQGPARPGFLPIDLGIVPQDAAVDARLSVYDTMIFYARLQGMTRAEAKRETERVLEIVTLTDRAGARLGELSHGMRRRFSIAQAMLGSPRLLLLDEPMNGLDPHVVAQMRELFMRLRSEYGATLLVSSHVLSDLEAICDYAVFMRAGHCVRNAAVHDLIARERTIRVRFRERPNGEFVADLAGRLPGFRVGIDGNELCVDGGDVSAAEQLNESVLSLILDIRKDIVNVAYGRSLERAYFESCVDSFEEGVGP